MTTTAKLLVLGPISEEFIRRLSDECEIIIPENIDEALRLIRQEDVSGVLLPGSERPTGCDAQRLVETDASVKADGSSSREHPAKCENSPEKDQFRSPSESASAASDFRHDADFPSPGVTEIPLAPSLELLDELPDGVVLVGDDLKIHWHNRRMRELSALEGSLIEAGFYAAFGEPEILGPDFCPLHTALGTGLPAHSTLRVGETYLDVQAKPIRDSQGELSSSLLVVVRDISVERHQQQKLSAIYKAGVALGDLSPQEISEMSVEERVELLKSKIIHYTQDLLKFETVEIRLVDRRTKQLDPLLADGMQPSAKQRTLFADPQGNGITGFVAATGQCYLCEDTANDPLYLPGAEGARSSLTVPLILHDEILGTFNVESKKPGAFNDNDLKFLELFSREVAIALNTLELLLAEKRTTATKSTEMILREVAIPVDEILADAAWILERYIGHEPTVCDRLRKVLKHTRDIKLLIQKVGRTISPQDVPSLPPRPEQSKFQGKRILVVDADESVRCAARELLARFGCDVEAVHDGESAFLMARTFHYDAVIVDIRLSDMTGFECFQQLREIHENLPVILMTGYGYDPSHSIVKARQMGLKSVLYKPFRLDQLLTELDKAFAQSTTGGNGMPS